MKIVHPIALALTCVGLLFFGAFLGWSAKGLLYSDDLPSQSPPANVPTSALWVGGPDGGVWIDCAKPAAVGKPFWCHVYAQQTGLLIERGNFEFPAEAIKPAFYSNGIIALKEARLVRALAAGSGLKF